MLARIVEHFYETLPGYFTFADFYAWVARRVPEGARCVEVGVFAGRSAAFLGVELHNAAKNATLDLVDASFDGGGVEGIRRALAPIAHVLGQVHAGASWDAASGYADESLDFVFIDAGHEQHEVRKDIDAWRPKVKRGGILAGHDFAPEYPGLNQAVNESFDRFEIWRGSAWSNGRYYPVWCVEKS